MARDAGAAKVYLASAAPPVRYPNVYGIDMPAAEELIANNRSVEQIQEIIGCDWLVYQDIEDLREAVSFGNRSVSNFEASCFTGEYATGDVGNEYLEDLASRRSDDAKKVTGQVSGS